MTEKEILDGIGHELESRGYVHMTNPEGVANILDNVDLAVDKLSNIAKVIEIYFMPWGAAKPAMWEGLTGEDRLLSAESALQYIKRELERN